MTERNEQRRERSKIEQALGLIPAYREMDPDSTNSNGELYEKLRTIEEAYQQLADTGVDVEEELRERRYQIMDCAISEIGLHLDILGGAVENRTGDLADGVGLNALQNATRALSKYARKVFHPEDLNDDFTFPED